MNIATAVKWFFAAASAACLLAVAFLSLSLSHLLLARSSLKTTLHCLLSLFFPDDDDDDDGGGDGIAQWNKWPNDDMCVWAALSERFNAF